MEEFSRHMESSGGMGHVLLITKMVEHRTQTKKPLDLRTYTVTLQPL